MILVVMFIFNISMDMMWEEVVVFCVIIVGIVSIVEIVVIKLYVIFKF